MVFTREETQIILAELSGTYHLMASLLYGAGLWLIECLRLRVKDLDFAVCQITVRAGKGDKDQLQCYRDRCSRPSATASYPGNAPVQRRAIIEVAIRHRRSAGFRSRPTVRAISVRTPTLASASCQLRLRWQEKSSPVVHPQSHRDRAGEDSPTSCEASPLQNTPFERMLAVITPRDTLRIHTPHTPLT